MFFLLSCVFVVKNVQYKTESMLNCSSHWLTALSQCFYVYHSILQYVSVLIPTQIVTPIELGPTARCRRLALEHPLCCTHVFHVFINAKTCLYFFIHRLMF